MPTENNSKFEMSLIISKWRGNVLDLFVYKLPFTVDRIFNYSVFGGVFFLGGVGGGIFFTVPPASLGFVTCHLVDTKYVKSN